MKKQSSRSISKTVITLILAGIISGFTSQSVYALPDKIPGKGVEVTYTGTRGKSLVFNVNYKNELSQPFDLTIRNDQNEIIYIEHYDAKPLDRSFLFSDVPENCKLTFHLTAGKKEKLTQTFEIKSQVKTVEEYIVKGI